MTELIPPTVNFVILVVILVYFLRKPVIEMVTTRRAAIKTQVDEAQTQKAEAQRRFGEFTEKLKAFEAEAASLLERARQDGENMKAKIVRDAQASAERIVKDAEATAQSNIQEFKNEIRRETISKAVEMAEQIIRERLSSDDQRRVLNEYVAKVLQA